MTPDPAVPEELRRLAATMASLEQQDRELGDSLFDATDGAGLVEVTLNGHGRLVGLRLDDRLLTLGAQEVADRINETAWAAMELITRTYDEAAPQMRAEVERVIATLPEEVQAQIRRSSEYAAGDSTS